MRTLERIGLNILKLLAAVSFVDAVYLFNDGDIKSSIYFGIAALTLWAATKEWDLNT